MYSRENMHSEKLEMTVLHEGFFKIKVSVFGALVFRSGGQCLNIFMMGRTSSAQTAMGFKSLFEARLGSTLESRPAKRTNDRATDSPDSPDLLQKLGLTERSQELVLGQDHTFRCGPPHALYTCFYNVDTSPSMINHLAMFLCANLLRYLLPCGSYLLYSGL